MKIRSFTRAAPINSGRGAPACAEEHAPPGRRVGVELRAQLANPVVRGGREGVAGLRAVERHPHDLARLPTPLFEQLRLNRLRRVLARVPPSTPLALSSAISASVLPSASSTSEVCSPSPGPA